MENEAAISDIVEYKFATPQERCGKTPPKHHWFQTMMGDKTEVEMALQGGESKRQALSEEELKRVRRERREKSRSFIKMNKSMRAASSTPTSGISGSKDAMFSHDSEVKLQDKEISELCKGVVDESEISRVKEWLEKEHFVDRTSPHSSFLSSMSSKSSTSILQKTKDGREGAINEYLKKIAKQKRM
ncbi:hypothetical protein GUITHDRAFT_113104 [Guillardia theta CCMP2712]|uniref:Uncharacterized protein n=1 Tax=Guillardia theta (strain CCMP2712) TaxID=905079 RepID=L1IX99_GUITC|nr:hypothetical protein GUITHDRAFT_113104 [Guillardia theta CCMP2712]EKX40841.1 hypothetical protein GUITHDRAFT_113104 [Guillardia theta CCMP2712]|eukprot:XP_005827821.1 hypothetical protein GUITHDRAFT_113104 [Guillardia theta CCMP2712]